MGNACTNRSKRDIIIPSKIMERPKIQNRLQNIEPENPKNDMSPTSHGKQSNITPQTSGEKQKKSPSSPYVDNNDKTRSTVHSSPSKIDISSLRIGKYYLENENKESPTRISAAQKNKTRKNNAKWDKIFVKERKGILISSPDSLYNETDLSLREFAIVKQRKYRKLLRKGIPQQYRWSVWKNHIEIDKFYEKGLYEKFQTLSSTWEEDIRKDVHRTFPHEPYFSSEKHDKIGQKHLFNVLKALSLYLPHIGYAQSMNYIVAFLLLVNGGKDEEAFWMFVSLARDHRFLAMGLFEKQFPLLEFYTFIFYEILQHKLPDLYKHIKSQNFPDLLWLFKWFLTIFLYSFPPKQVLRIWDFILVRGLFSMIQVALGVVEFIEKDMLRLDTPGMDTLFKYLKGETYLIDSSGNRIPLVDDQQNKNSQYHFKKLDIIKILKYAEKTHIGLQKISSFAASYSIKTGKSLPILYENFFRDWYKIKDNKDKLSEFQSEIDAYITKNGTSEKIKPREEPEQEKEKTEEVLNFENVNVIKINHTNERV